MPRPPALPRSANHGFNLRYQPPRVRVRLSKGTGRERVAANLAKLNQLTALPCPEMEIVFRNSVA
ncbi:hypothetical protein Poly24_04310 [Rosistilla carotiformis]|uniref:Uncharacterized protein n=1 Tax=Rosistilla carotiformis TaxID=2528017 RepID=A0A518JMH1_9BACT|nr:hypothetical protein Poly24_04310 [Rosistilla carotiformis]